MRGDSAVARTQAGLIERDLAGLGVMPMTALPALPARKAMFDPIAVEYVLLGAAMGLQILRRRWAASDDTDVQAAANYMSAPGRGADWRAFCDRASALPHDAVGADKIVDHARDVFHLFETAARRAVQHPVQEIFHA